MILIGLMLALVSVFVSPGGECLTSGANVYNAIDQSALTVNHIEQHQLLYLSSESVSSGLFFAAELEPEVEENEDEDESLHSGSFFIHHKDLVKQFVQPSAHPSSSRALLFPATTRIILYQVFLI
jgi:hypothetical protein